MRYSRALSCVHLCAWSCAASVALASFALFHLHTARSFGLCRARFHSCPVPKCVSCAQCQHTENVLPVESCIVSGRHEQTNNRIRKRNPNNEIQATQNRSHRTKSIFDRVHFGFDDGKTHGKNSMAHEPSPGSIQEFVLCAHRVLLLLLLMFILMVLLLFCCIDESINVVVH